MIAIFFHPEAQIELFSAAQYYEEQQSSLGKRFLEAIQITLLHIQINPRIFCEIENGLKKSKVPKFPYGIIFRYKNKRIEIISIMHLHRKPGYWKTRTAYFNIS